MDTESSLRRAKDNAEGQAARSVNQDLKDHVARLNQGLQRSTAPVNDESRRLMGDLVSKYD